MMLRGLLLAGIAFVLGGCSSYEGLYTPSCIAYEGSEMRLSEGRFVWTRFSDQVLLDEKGNEIDQFPGFPRTGEYSKDGRRITLPADADQPATTLYLFRSGAESYLYTAEEAGAFEATGERPRCPLKLQAQGTEN